MQVVPEFCIDSQLLLSSLFKIRSECSAEYRSNVREHTLWFPCFGKKHTHFYLGNYPIVRGVDIERILRLHRITENGIAQQAWRLPIEIRRLEGIDRGIRVVERRVILSAFDARSYECIARVSNY